MRRRQALAVEPRFEGPDLLLQAVHTGFELDQLGAKSHLVQLLLDPIQPLFDLTRSSFDPIQPLLDALQPGDEQWYSVSSRSKRW
jgi:hypothetical protein